MFWVIEKQQNGKPYYLQRVNASGRAIWTASTSSAIQYTNEKAAKYTIKHTGLTQVAVKSVKR